MGKTSIPEVANREMSTEEKKQVFFEELWKRTLTEFAGGEGIVEIRYDASHPKEEFLDFLVEQKGLLLHGSNRRDLQELEARPANDRAKKFGNKTAIYAVNDPVLPIFYAILRREDIRRMVESSREDDEHGGAIGYHFQIPKEALEKRPWSKGAIYIVDKAKFEQGTDDDRRPIRKWAAKPPVIPIAKIEVGPEDFRFLDEVRSLEEDL